MGEEDIAQVVSMWTGIPVTRIAQEESERLLHMEEALHKRVIGQQEAIDTISKAVRRARAGLKDPKRPIGSFIFLGPTGVGKTELAKAVAEFMFGSEDALIKIDMSEFMERHNVSRLVGAPPGYVGFEEGGQLTEAVRRKSYSVVLLDEIEKAHPEVFNILLQILEDGHLTDAKGRRVDFRNTVIIMTSNVGAKSLLKDTTLGFRPMSTSEELERDRQYDRMKDKVMEQLKSQFRPEFLNRVDSSWCSGRSRSRRSAQIVDLLLARVREQLRAQQIELDITQEAKDHIIKLGYDVGLRRATAAARHPEHGRGPARGGAAAGPVPARPDGGRGPVTRRRPDHRAARREDARREEPVEAWPGPRCPRHAAVARTESRYVCQTCGAVSAAWEGRCHVCGEWGSLVETLVRPRASHDARRATGAPGGATPRPLGEVASRPVERLPVGIGEVDRVLGGGLVPGALVLLGGEPGIGKSTLVHGDRRGRGTRWRGGLGPSRRACCTRPARSQRSSCTCGRRVSTSSKAARAPASGARRDLPRGACLPPPRSHDPGSSSSTRCRR